MRRPAGLPAMRNGIAARDPDGAGVLLHALRQAQSARHQRAQFQRAEDARRIQGLARSRLRLLLEQEAGSASEADAQRRQELSDRAAMDDQPLTANSNQNRRQPP